MNKSDLNNCMLFKFKNGKLYTLSQDLDEDYVFYNKEDIKNGYNSNGILLDDYPEDLSLEVDEYDIIAIKQFPTCLQVLHMILNEKEPDELDWDWVKEVGKSKSKQKQVVHNHNYTINIQIDPECDIETVIKQLEENLKKFRVFAN